ncbi:MAG: hypothetical protein UR92_C0028G0004 [Candidatus Nomurabacteria bacterium GW2011_GWA2_35_80]|uniref:Baseplate protein J-like domain-containing protein n=1 Tax=Candidatus Nomurabacteria bacterium GW2011_GWA2_35_80 TaxID=1618733 RepID=A0A0G0FJP5_9BACT|nr:MAG: hypothetical protein UR92_C0028G0004 [Candidatus Nomurabacteria bacterium GW2011_GWA2_35_80]
MPRNLLQDMVRKAPAKRGMIQREKPAYHTFSAADADGEKIPDKTKQNSKGSKYRLYFVALISVIFLLFALSFLFSSAKVVVTPKVKEIPLNENLSAAKDSNTSSLSFDLVVISGEENKIIQGGEEKDVVIAAKGTVLIYNAYSSSSQTLDIDTRLEGSNGKIYKTSKKITVPGMTKDNKPGSIEVGIYGAETGEEYNSVPLDFKIFGFRGTPKYSKFYARSKGEITGGFKGKAPVVSSLDKATAVSELETTLKAKLLKKATDQIPSGFILFKDAIFLDIDEAQDIIDKYDGSEIYIPNIRDLTFSFTDKENISFADVKNIGFTLSGIPKIVYKVNEEKFTADLLNKKKKDFNQILAQYPNISSAELIFRPFWKASFPEKSESIEIIVNYPK